MIKNPGKSVKLEFYAISVERKSVMDSDGFAGSIIISAFVLIKAFFAAGEYAVTEVNDSRVRSFSNGNRRERRLFRLLQKPARLITAFSVNRIFSAVLIAYIALFVFCGPLALFFEKRLFGYARGEPGASGGWPELLSAVAAAAVILLLTVFVLTVFCDGLPRRIAALFDVEKLALFCALPVELMAAFFTPLTAVSGAAVSLLARLCGSKSPAAADAVTEEEILMMVDAGNETGVIEESQKEMINNVFEFSELTASDIMTHRTDVVGVENTAGISEVVNTAIESGFSRLPVYENSIDHIAGIICVKDLLCMVGSEPAASAKAKDFIRDVIYVPETIPCGELFKLLTENKMQMAAVADEYGGTAGIVTMEDVVESIFGSIQDEYDDEAEEIIQISDDTYTIDGTAEPEHILGRLGITLPEDNNFDTISGFIVSLLGRIPEESENPSVTYGNVVFTVLITEDMRITKLKATVMKNDGGKDENISKEKSEDYEGNEEEN